MNKVRYIIRLDDACPTMDSKKWDLYEKFFDEYDIKPIIAVIPNNQDDDMLYEESDNFFWDKVRRWQEKGWHIALHGFNHKYETTDGGIIPINDNSEFAGLSFEKQKQKISQGWEIFQKENIKSNIWIAPAHAFDYDTVEALKSETTIKIVSDGFAFKPYFEKGMLWIPQQLWRLKKKNIPGIYTICYHPNMTSIEDIKKELEILKENKNMICSDIDSLYEEYNKRQKSIFDSLYHQMFFFNRKLRKVIKQVIFYDKWRKR